MKNKQTINFTLIPKKSGRKRIEPCNNSEIKHNIQSHLINN